MADMELVLSTSEGEPSSSEDQEDDLDITDSDGAESEEPIVAGPSDGGGQVSNVASASNAGEEVVGVKEKNNNKTKVQTIDGVDLFPPDGSKMRKASLAWSYGGLKKDDKGRLLRDKMYCALCPKTFNYNQSPSALSDHLRHKHADKMLELESAKQSQSKLTDFRFTKAEVQEKYKGSHPKQKKFRSDLVDWVVTDKRPFAISDDRGLRKVVKNLDPRITVPAGRTISRDIAKKYSEKKKITIEKLKNVDYFSCTNDGGTSLSNSSFIAINVHWVDENCQAQVRSPKS